MRGTLVDLRALSAAAGLLTLIAGGPARAAECPEPGCAKPLERPAAQGTSVVDGPAPLPIDGPAASPIAEDNRAVHDEQAAQKPRIDEPAQPPATDGEPADREKPARAAATPEPQAEEPAKADVADAINAMCSALEQAAAANGLPLEFFARVIWEESRFQPRAVGPLTRSGLRAQGIAQFMPYTAAERGLLDPLDPQTALPEAAEFLAELRGEFGNLGLAAAAYNAGPGRLRDFIARRGGMPGQTRHYVRAITGRSIEEWVALGRADDDEKDKISTPASCRQLAALLKERPSVFVAKVERKVREAALLPQTSDRRNAAARASGAKRAASGLKESAAARNRRLLLVRTASLLIPEKAARKPSSSGASEDLKSSSSTPAKSRKSIAVASRSTPATSRSSGPQAARAVAAKEAAQSKPATRAARDATARVAAQNRTSPPVRTASLAPTGQSPTKPSAGSAESKSLSATPAKVGKRSTSEASMQPVSKPSPAKPAPGRARALSPEKTSRDNASVRVAARPTGSRASERDRNALSGRTGSPPTTKDPNRKTIASAAPGEAGKSIGAVRRSTLPKLSTLKPASGRLRASAMEKVVKNADERVKKVMQICRGC
jgi:soluble lytic murein transglycosylase-like protein